MRCWGDLGVSGRSLVYQKSLTIPLGPHGGPQAVCATLGRGGQAPRPALKHLGHQDLMTQPNTTSRGAPGSTWGTSGAGLRWIREGSPFLFVGGVVVGGRLVLRVQRSWMVGAECRAMAWQ